MARLSILTKDEINALYAIPTLDDEERSFLFSLDVEDQVILDTLEKDTARKIDYILQLGYYRAIGYFFLFSFQKVKADVDFIMQLYFSEESLAKKQVSKNHHYHNRCEVMNRFDLKDADARFQSQLLKEAKALAKRHSLSRFVLEELLSYCQLHNVLRPAYSSLQDIVSSALREERRRLVNKLYTDTDKELRGQLDTLLANDALFYNLTLLKKDQKDFSTTEIKKSVAKQQLILGIYQQSKVLMPKLGLSEQNIIYYANLAEFYSVQKLRRFADKNLVRLYLLCYAHRRFLKINDHLISSLIQKMSKYADGADDYQRSKIALLETTDTQLRHQAYQVMAINIDKRIPDEQVRAKAFEVIPFADYKQFLNDFNKPNVDRDFYRWQYYGDIGLTIKRNIRPLFKALEFSCTNEGLIQAIAFLRQHLNGSQSFRDYEYQDVPMDFFPKSLKKFLTYKVIVDGHPSVKKVDGDRYESMVYHQLKQGIANTTVFIKDSHCYCALEDDLIDADDWTQNKEQILQQLNMPLLSMDIEGLLSQLEASIHVKYDQVNQHIRRGENPSLKTHYNKQGDLLKWTLPYTRLDDGINNPFYEKLRISSIGDILKFSAETTGFMKAFSHLQPKYAKASPDPEVIYACIIANATGIETKKMKDISDVNENDLDRVNKNYIRYQTLYTSNDVIMNHTAKLPIFAEYNLSDYGIHASVDGQKFATKYHTIKSRYAKKYFGLLKGVVLYSLNANHLPLCLKVIGANQHESHFLLDIVESNTSDVEITAVSGDMHSINRVNFALMYLFGYRFMPRFTQLCEKSNQHLVCFDELENHAQHLIKPSKRVNKALIIKEWDKVLRILASLALKKTTQSQIVSKLSSYKKTNPTLKALIAFDEIIMTDYLLDYIDSKEIRAVVQGSLNRGESYHQLSSTIAKVSGGRMLSGKTEIELDINAESIRLIANAVIFYNATLLSTLYQHYQAVDPEMAKAIRRFSPVAWRHINFIGRYEFYAGADVLNIQELINNIVASFEIDISSVRH
ncbi:MAG: Tn3 family transposase [Methylococcaceae bacterium]|nr:Tn3 family transposase [Methylococcaceae bacterium]MDD1610664.1 Tn3 family transposase [Methylococcaceae bacterium]